MKSDRMATIRATSPGVVAGVSNVPATKASHAMAWGFQQAISLGQQGLDGIPVTSHHCCVIDGYLPDHCVGAPAGVSAIPVLWGQRRMGNTMPSWSEFGKSELKIPFFRWRHEDSEVNGIWALQDIAQALQKDRFVSGPQKLRWLVQMAHVAFSRLVRDKVTATSLGLTERELEVMKWTADGKSAQDVADILLVSKHTVEFHIKNSVAKLEAPNKTAAAVRATLLGLLS